jgi:hypothetical protein
VSCAAPAVVTEMPEPQPSVDGTYFASYAGNPGPANVNVAMSVQVPLAACTPVSTACPWAVFGAEYWTALGGPGGGVGHAAMPGVEIFAGALAVGDSGADVGAFFE